MKPRAAAILVILALTSAGTVARQAAPAQQPTFSTRVTQVEVYATVTGRDGRAIKGLSAEEFTVLEDGVPQKVTTFVGGDFPASVALAIDRSFSMTGTPLTVARTAGRAFVASLGPADRAMLISISGDIDVLAPLDVDKSRLLAALDALDPWGSTSLNDALIRSLDLLEGETGRRAIVVLSDGVDRYSDASDADVVNRARRSDVLIYPIALAKTRPPLFVELATITGGRSFHLRDVRQLQPTLQSIVEDLRSQYLIGYEPALPQSEDAGEWRSITVTVHRPDAKVRARSGYSTK